MTVRAEAGLADDLSGAIRGEVRFSDGDRALYATDASNYRQVPIGVVVPRDADDVAATLEVCRSHSAPVLARGGGTSLAGQCCNVAVVLDMSKYMRDVVELDPAARRARVQPGCVLDRLRDAAEEHGLTFGPDPATHDHCTLGGMIGNNSCGVHSVMAGRTADNVESLEILTYDGLRMRVGPTPDEELQRLAAEDGRRGEIYRRLRELRDRYAAEIRARYPDIPRRVSGYNLDELLPERGFNVARALVGTESTCAIVLEADVRLVPSPRARTLVVLGYPDVFSAADHVPQILEHGPIGLEGIDDLLVEFTRRKGLHPDSLEFLPAGRGWLLVELGGDDRQEADARARGLLERLRAEPDAPEMRMYDDPRIEKKVWAVRESGLGATAFVPGEPDAWPGWEDAAVPPERLGDYLREFRGLLERYEYRATLYGHFGQGCVHSRIPFELTSREGVDAFRRFLDEAAALVVSCGGSLSGEHGDGQARAALLPKMYGAEIVQAFREFKSIWDPGGRMNPGKVVDPYRADQNLRLGPAYAPPEPQTSFSFPEDAGSFAHAALRCVGVGACRREHGGTMCPSYMVTREEKHSTRGRARLLFEMLRGDAIRGGWREEVVHDALDLCLACKGCKSDCPVDVDMATYKAEFLSHYYRGRLRPRSAYAMGLIFLWARIAQRMPRAVNALAAAPLLSRAVKAAGGIAPRRRIPAFAPQSFTEWFRARPARTSGGRKVVLWPDTFNDHFHPEIAQAAVEVLEAAGFRVTLPDRWLCCGRPLYDYGMLGLAKRLLHRTLDALADDIRAGAPVVVLEPSCAAVFRDELPNLFPHDQDARRLAKQTRTLAEILDDAGWDPPPLHRRAVVHGHCHHKAIMGLDADRRILDRLGLDYEILDSGCCGMAGAFGFEAEHYDVSVACGERVLLPAVRDASDDTLVVTDGFSCREQVAQQTGRRALHLAEIVALAVRGAAPHPDGHRNAAAAKAAVAVTLVAAGAAGAWLWRRRGHAAS